MSTTEGPVAPPGVVMPTVTAATGTLVAPRPADGGDGGGRPEAGPVGDGPAPTPRRLPSPLRPREMAPADVALTVAAAFASFALVWVVFDELTLLSGAFGFLVCWYLGFIGLLWIGTAQTIERQVATDRVMATLMTSGALLVVGLVVFIVVWVAYKALPTIHWGALLTKDSVRLDPSDPNALAHVGVFHAILGTAEQVAGAVVFGVPIAIATAVYLNEVGGRGARYVRIVVTAMSGTPTVVAGAFIYSMLILTHVLSYSGFAASLALTVILLPSVTRVVEEVLRVVPDGLREASQALGAPRWRTVWSVVLPTARSGVVTAVLLGVARIVGETAPLIFTSFGSQVTNGDWFAHPQAALPLLIFQNVTQAQSVFIDLAFQGAFVLISIVLILFVSARFFSRPRTAKGRSRNAARTSRTPRGGPGTDVLARSFVPVPFEKEQGP